MLDLPCWLLLCFVVMLQILRRVSGADVDSPMKGKSVEIRSLEQQSEEICYTGYVMDTYCIDRGTLFDLYLTDTLQEPNRHSIHCLVDVDRCVQSGYEILLDNPNEDGLHCRALELDDAGTEMLVELARSTGEADYCETCSGPMGSQVRGFRATVFGRILPGTDNPPKLSVTRVDHAINGCPDGYDVYVPNQVNCDSGSYVPYFAAHGTLMLLSWGFLLPGGVVAARLLKYRKDSLWFKIHRIVQPLGLLLALAGWLTALAGPFNVLGSGVYDVSFAHAFMGTVAMALGLFQPINAYFRPHKPNSGACSTDEQDFAAVSTKRRKWELLHKTTGYVAATIAIANCFIGMALSGKFSDYFLYGLIATLGSLVIAVIALVFLSYKSRQSSLLPGADGTDAAGVNEPESGGSCENKPLTDEDEKS